MRPSTDKRVVVAPDGRSLTADFPLFRKPSGLYDVVVSNPDLGTGDALFCAFRVIGGLSLSWIAPVQAPDLILRRTGHRAMGRDLAAGDGRGPDSVLPRPSPDTRSR